MSSPVTQIVAAAPATALGRFAEKLQFETDCSDVNRAQQAGVADFVLLDVRGPQLFAAGHVPGAINLPVAEITAERLAAFPAGTLFVTYCAGPHCNGATKAAVRLAGLGRPVKEMIGGVTGWLDEGLRLVAGSAADAPVLACGCEAAA